jgi:magnesium transporter
MTPRSRIVETIVCKYVPLARGDETVVNVRRKLLSQGYSCVDLIIICTREGAYAGVADLREVLNAPANDKMSLHLLSGVPVVAPDMAQEQAAEAATNANLAALPVVDATGRPVGLIPSAAMLGVLSQERHEDAHRLAGILHRLPNVSEALDDPPMRRAGRRLPWLIVGTVLSAIVTATMAWFEDALRQNVRIALFIPAIVYLADAIGTQTEAIAVRGLSTRSHPLGRILRLEVIAGGLIGATLGSIAFLGIWAVFGSLDIASGVGLSLVAAGTLATAIGLLLPWALSRMGLDPALGSGPVATVVQDGLTILIYFQVMSIILPAI